MEKILQTTAYWSEEATENSSTLEEVGELTLDQEESLLEGLALFFWFMPGGSLNFYRRLGEGSFELLDVTDKEETFVFFGGAFDPWHKGHRACLELCGKKRIIVVPERGPWKDGRPTNLRDFLALIPETRDIAFGLYPGFLTRKTPSPTVEWMTQVKGRKAFLVGADHLRDFPKWHRFQELLACLEALYVAPRAVHDNHSGAMDHLFHQWRDELQALTKTPIHLLDNHPFEHLSSTLLRLEKALKGE